MFQITCYHPITNPMPVAKMEQLLLLIDSVQHGSPSFTDPRQSATSWDDAYWGKMDSILIATDPNHKIVGYLLAGDFTNFFPAADDDEGSDELRDVLFPPDCTVTPALYLCIAQFGIHGGYNDSKTTTSIATQLTDTLVRDNPTRSILYSTHLWIHGTTQPNPSTALFESLGYWFVPNAQGEPFTMEQDGRRCLFLLRKAASGMDDDDDEEEEEEPALDPKMFGSKRDLC